MKERQLWHLPKKTQIESIKVRRLSVSLIMIICGMLVLLALWAYFVRVQELSLATGKIAPVTRISVVQHLEGGVVYQVLVDEGSQVKKGQPLAEIDETLAKAELQKLEAKRLALLSDIQREKSVLDQTNFKVTLPKTNVQNNETDVSINEILKRQQQLYQIQLKTLTAKQNVIVQQSLQREAELLKLYEELKTAQKNAALHQEEVNMFSELIESGYVSKLDFIRAKRNLNTALGNIAQINKKITIAKDAVKESQNQLIELTQTEKQEAADRLRKMQHELFEVQFGIKKVKRHLDNTVIRAPIAGTVVNLKITKGEVLSAGGFAMNIVPSNARLRAEIRIRPADMGFVKVGDPVLVKVTAYHFTQYGGIHGKLTYLSPAALLDEKKQPYYLGWVSLEHNYVGLKANKIIPGMTVNADVITGEKSLLAYLFKPVRIFASQSFYEK